MAGQGAAGMEHNEGTHVSPTPKKNQKTAALRVRLSEQQMANLRRLAQDKGCSVSDFVRTLLVPQLEGQP